MKDDYILESTEVRSEVYWYAKRMEMRLREKDATKGHNGWRDGKLHYYLKKVASCTALILGIIRAGKNMHGMGIHLAIKKCIDGGNFFMMLADNLKDELVKRGING